MRSAVLAPVEFGEWGWLFGFALISLCLVALAVLAEALYEGYRQRARRTKWAFREESTPRDQGQSQQETHKAA